MEEKIVPFGLLILATIIVAICFCFFLATLSEDASDVKDRMREAIKLSIYPDAVKWHKEHGKAMQRITGLIGFNGFKPSESRFDTLAADIYSDEHAVYRLVASDTTLTIKADSHVKFDGEIQTVNARINSRRELFLE
ncbi:MAG: hypothetical protein ACREOO_03960 [bacterium]